jgi:hypothetical protein
VTSLSFGVAASAHKRTNFLYRAASKVQPDRATDRTEICCVADAFRRREGLATSDHVLFLLSQHTDQPISVLAHWIVNHEAIHFQWRSHTLLPLFQFDRRDMSLVPEVKRVTEELAAVLDEWEIAVWFSRPNRSIGGRTPLLHIERDCGAVLEAARAHRFALR